MKASILARRQADAQDRIAAAVEALADNADLDAEATALKNAQHRDPNIARLFQTEAVADILEKLAGSNEAGCEEEDAAYLGAPDVPDDFPGKAPLEKAGVTHLSQVDRLTREDLIAIPGIGYATADRIREARGLSATDGPTDAELHDGDEEPEGESF